MGDFLGSRPHLSVSGGQHQPCLPMPSQGSGAGVCVWVETQTRCLSKGRCGVGRWALLPAKGWQAEWALWEGAQDPPHPTPFLPLHTSPSSANTATTVVLVAGLGTASCLSLSGITDATGCYQVYGATIAGFLGEWGSLGGGGLGL